MKYQKWATIKRGACGEYIVLHGWTHSNDVGAFTYQQKDKAEAWAKWWVTGEEN